MNDKDKKDILKQIIQECRQSINEISKKDVNELQKQLKVLEKIVSSHEEDYNEKSAEYWSKAKLGSSYFFRGKQEQSYTQALEAITKILDILRGEPLTITIQKVQRNSEGKIVNVSVYKGKESNLKLKYNAKYRQVEYDLEQSLNALEKIEDANEAYIQHYSNFYNIANQHIKSTRSHSSSTGWRKKINEGNIVEAYQRHMHMKHALSNNALPSYTDNFTAQEVLILLYYSTGNVPWWQQGDIGYNQIKLANSTKLASTVSIRRVAAKILAIFSDPAQFDVKEFNEIFTAQDQDQMTDISDLTNDAIQTILTKLKATGQFK